MKRLSRRAVIALLFLAALTTLLWERASWRPRLVAPPPKKHHSYSLAWPQNDLLYCAATSRDIEIYKIPQRGPLSPVPVRTIPFPGSLAAGDIIVSPDKSRVIIVNSVEGGVVWLWDETQRKAKTWRIRLCDPIRAAILNDNKTVAVTWWTPYDDTALLFELRNVISGTSQKWPRFKRAPTVSLNGELMAVTESHDDKKIILYDLLTRQQKLVLPGVREPNRLSLTLSPDGKYLAAMDSFETLNIYDTKTGKLLWKKRVCFGKGEAFCSAKWSNDASLIATTNDSASADLALRLWDAATGKQVREVLPPTNRHAVNDMVFSPDGSLLATSREDIGVQIWRIK